MSIARADDVSHETAARAVATLVPRILTNLAGGSGQHDIAPPTAEVTLDAEATLVTDATRDGVFEVMPARAN